MAKDCRNRDSIPHTIGEITMMSLRIFLFRLRSLFQKRKLEQDLADEIQSHLEMQMEEDQRRGMSADDARYSALRKFGGVDQVKEVYRQRRGLQFVETFLRDLGYGLRMLRRSPGIAAVAILSLGLGIGANTALFSVVDAVLFKTLPVVAPEQLVIFEWQAGRLFRTSGMSGTSNVSTPPNMRGLSLFRYDVFENMQRARIAAQGDSPITDLFAFGPIREMNARVGDDAEVIDGQAVSGGYYSGLRIQPSLGRPITDEDDKVGATPVVVLSDRYLARAVRWPGCGYRATTHTEQASIHYHRRNITGIYRNVASGLSARCHNPAGSRALAARREQQTGHSKEAWALVVEFDGTSQTWGNLCTGRRQFERCVSIHRAGSHAAPEESKSNRRNSSRKITRACSRNLAARGCRIVEKICADHLRIVHCGGAGAADCLCEPGQLVARARNIAGTGNQCAACCGSCALASRTATAY